MSYPFVFILRGRSTKKEEEKNMVTGVMPFDSGREVINETTGGGQNVSRSSGQNVPFYCRFKSSFSNKKKKEKKVKLFCEGLLNRKDCTRGSRLHGMEVVWCHRGGKGHREDSATGTIVCFVYTANISHSTNAGLLTFVP